MERVESGIPGLDEAIEGGFPKSSLILLEGGPGSGKTNLGAKFLFAGARKGEPGVYVSIAEGKETFTKYMLELGMDFSRLESQKKFTFLDLATTREAGVAEVLEFVLSTIQSTKSTRIVIDSFTALATAISTPVDARIITHTILGKMTRQLGCTTVLISEQKGAHFSQEGFVADGVIELGSLNVNGGFVRELTIHKMRGTEIKQRKFVFTLHGGFKIFHKFPKIEDVRSRYKPLEDGKDYFSTGSEDLDRLIGGFPRKASVLFEATLPATFVGASYLAQWLNFISQKRGVIIVPKEGVDAYQIRENVTRFIDPGTFDKFVKIFEKREEKSQEPYAVGLSGEPSEDMRIFKETAKELKGNSGGKSILWWFGADRLEHMYDYDDLMRLMSDLQVYAQRSDDITVRRCAAESQTTPALSHMSSIHMKFAEPNGILLLMGIKPVFPPQHFDVDSSSGFPRVKLTPFT